MKKIILFTFIAFLYSTAYAQIKVACIGNSITAGSGIKNRDKDSYPSVLNQMLGMTPSLRTGNTRMTSNLIWKQ